MLQLLILTFCLLYNKRVLTNLRICQHIFHDILANGVVTTSIIIGSIFFASDELFRVEEPAVRASTHLICNKEFIICNSAVGNLGLKKPSLT